MFKSLLLKHIYRNKAVYLLLLPGLAFYIIFCYIPMFGLQIAFKDFMANKGFWGSPWNDFQSFKFLLKDFDFWRAVKNTITISSLSILIITPFPILLAILISEFKDGLYKKVLQTVFTFPHFITWVVMSGIIYNLLGSSGSVNTLLLMLGYESRNFLGDTALFRPIVFVSSILKEAGWSSIIYLATIAGINPELYDAVTVDGANRFKKIIHITLPSLMPTITILFILHVGRIMDFNFDMIFNLYNPVVYPVADIIDTYIYRISFPSALSSSTADFGYTTAVGLFKSVINFILLLIANKSVKLFGQDGLI